MRRYLNAFSIAKLAVVLAGAGMLATAANAQARFTGRFTLPCETNWAGKVLPAGQYKLIVPPLALTPYILVEQVKGTERMYIASGPSQEKSSDQNVIVLTQTGNRCVVRAMNLADIDEEIIYQPKRGPEMALKHKGQRTQTVTLAVAKR